jgi:hypothetical protein
MFGLYAWKLLLTGIYYRSVHSYIRAISVQIWHPRVKLLNDGLSWRNTYPYLLKCVWFSGKLHWFMKGWDRNYSMINLGVDFDKYYWRRNKHIYLWIWWKVHVNMVKGTQLNCLNIFFWQKLSQYLICMILKLFKYVNFWQVWISLIMRQIFLCCLILKQKECIWLVMNMKMHIFVWYYYFVQKVFKFRIAMILYYMCMIIWKLLLISCLLILKMIWVYFEIIVSW